MARYFLKIAKEVAAGTAECDYVVPAIGATQITVLRFYAEGFDSVNSVIRMTWKLNHASETEDNIWTIKGSHNMPFKYEIDPAEADDIRKLGVCCENGEAGDAYMSAWAEVIIE